MSRIIVKNLPSYITKKRLNETFSEYGTVTDLRMLYTGGGKFRRIAFVGYTGENDSQRAIDARHNTYIDTCKLTVEVAKSANDESLERPWSKYSEGSSASTKFQDGKLKRMRVIQKLKMSKLNPAKARTFVPDNRRKNDADHHHQMVMETCGIAPEDRGKYNEYLELNNMKVDNDTCLGGFTTEKYADEKDQTSPCNNNNNPIFTVKLFNLRPNVNVKQLIKFFQGLGVVDIRILPPLSGKKVCIAFVDFSSEVHFQQALGMSGTYLRGVRVHITRAEPMDNASPKESHKICHESLLDTGRLFVRNLPFVCSEEELRDLFEQFGAVVDLSLPVDRNTSKAIGIAFVTFMLPENAVTAYNKLDNTIFKGRLLHLIPAHPDQDGGVNSEEGSYKKQKLVRLKGNSPNTWNSLFINQNAVANIVSNRLGVSKEQLLLDSSDTNNPAVSMAAAETALVNETKIFLESRGVNLDCFSKGGGIATGKKSDKILLIKNLPENVTAKELMDFFSEKLRWNSAEESENLDEALKPRIILPPYGVTAIVEFNNAYAAKIAFNKLAFTRFKFTPLYLEWAPIDSLSIKTTSKSPENTDSLGKHKDISEEISGCVVFVKNLDFSTTKDTVHEVLSKAGQVRSVTLATKKGMGGKETSLGYGFVEFSNPKFAKECVKTMQGCKIDGSVIHLKLSDRKVTQKIIARPGDAPSIEEQETIPKILVKNVAFEATQNDIYELFKTYGNLKTVRLPLKLNPAGNGEKQHRGFAFVEFTTLEDAKHCFECLRYSTHLYGRRLVLEWANDTTSISSIRKRTAEHFHRGSGEVSAKKFAAQLSENLQQI